VSECSPYIIGTTDQPTCSSTSLQLHHNFRWVLCANHSEPLLGLAGRYLRRRLAAARPGRGGGGGDDEKGQDDGTTDGMDEVVDWLTDVWRRLNRLLETHHSHDVTVGEHDRTAGPPHGHLLHTVASISPPSQGWDLELRG